MDDKKKTEAIQMNGSSRPDEVMINEKQEEKFPKSIPFIIGNEFCERFCFYGMRAILTLYFVNILGYSDNKATEAFHLFAMFCYFTPLLGAFIADSYIGKYLTILYLSIVYCLGNILLSFASYAESEILTITGLGFIALGTGGIKPCVSAFGGDQFKNKNSPLLEKFFGLFYLSINLGSLVSMFLTPIFRKDITCFGKNSCYPLAFGVPALLMIIALILFLIGTPLYVRLPSAKGNIVIEFISCVVYALYKKVTNLFSRSNSPSHFMDYAASKYNSKLIEDSKAVLSCFLLLIPLPIFWSLFDQQGSKWVLQAENLNGEISFLNWNYTLRADQFQIFNPLIVVFLIPVFEYGVYPVLEKINLLTKPLQRMSVGGLIAASAFACSGILELHMQSMKISAPTAVEANLNLILLNSKTIERVSLQSRGEKFLKQNDMNNRFIDFGTIPIGNYSLNAFVAKNELNFTRDLELKGGSVYSVMIYEKDGKLNYELDEKDEIIPTYKNLELKIYLNQEKYLNKNKKSIENIYVYNHGKKTDPIKTLSAENSLIYYSSIFNLTDLPDGYDIYFDNKKVYTFKGISARSYKLVILAKENDEFDISVYEWLNFKNVSMLWQFVQYLVITVAEIMVSITGLSFYYSEAPIAMKSVVSAAWLCTNALGDLFVVIITSLAHFESQAMSFFFYGLLMALDMLLFITLAYYYKPRNNSEEEVLELRNKESNDLKKS